MDAAVEIYNATKHGFRLLAASQVRSTGDPQRKTGGATSQPAQALAFCVPHGHTFTHSLARHKPQLRLSALEQ